MTGKLRALGAAPSIGSDAESAMGGDMFTNMRMALQYQRALNNRKVIDRTKQAPEHISITAREALEWATINGAKMAGLEQRTGSLTPGKQADIVLLRSDDLNMIPVIDPVHAIVFYAGISNVDTVLVAGRVVKQGGRLVSRDLGHLKAQLGASSQHVLETAGRLH